MSPPYSYKKKRILAQYNAPLIYDLDPSNELRIWEVILLFREYTATNAKKEEPHGKIAWEESVKKSRENNENDSTLLRRKLGETRKAIGTGGSSRNKLSALTPLKKSG
ncbi:AMP_1a_G0014510.mRNA.1.CDS.1 [Saccharomyces cerevisiae]|nr:AMP_1a_G0014510.mRNA.1.CDS.1 [Saccharomyces cerevisiae]CAI6532328.1 AMP_1a_G0014510.mRNA.1.CDS.1 [Saccharomyces cerevisiae]